LSHSASPGALFLDFGPIPNISQYVYANIPKMEEKKAKV
jgi:hypothetical protein